MQLSGCTSYDTSQETAKAGATLTDLEYQMVLDNVAMYRFIKSPNVLPSFSLVQAGTIQIGDTPFSVSPNLSYAWSPWTWAGGLAPGRKWQDSWTLIPTTDPNAIPKLQALFWNAAADRTDFRDGRGPGSHDIVGHYRSCWVWVPDANRAPLSDLTFAAIAAVTNLAHPVIAGPGIQLQ